LPPLLHDVAAGYDSFTVLKPPPTTLLRLVAAPAAAKNPATTHHCSHHRAQSTPLPLSPCCAAPSPCSIKAAAQSSHPLSAEEKKNNEKERIKELKKERRN
jgi:hypothetical protein